MCGILGILAANGRSLPSGVLDAIELLRHRGPDGEGRYSDGPVALAMRRLAIIDLTTGDQPIANEDGSIVCICNGEIYNYVELRRELAGRGHRLSTSGDVEVIVHLYEELGEQCFERLRGMFGIALWDARARRLLLARDRFGIKPLYLADVPDGLAFASEIRPLLALGADTSIDVQAVADVLSLGYPTGTATGVAGVRSLEPGVALVWEADAMIERRYAGVTTAAGEVEATIRQAVDLHLRSDVSLGVLLSGGIDSSLIASLAADAGGPPLKTFVVGFGDPGFDELGPARQVAQALGTEHHEVAVRADAAADLPAIVASLEEPLADPSAIPLWYVCRAVAGHVKVALAGEGGDEVFGGYSRYAWDRRAAAVGRILPAATLAAVLEGLPGVAARAARADRKSVVRRAVKLLRNAGKEPAERYFSWFALLSEEGKAEILAGGVPFLPGSRVFAELMAAAPAGLTALGTLQYVDLRTMLLKDLLLKADKMSMAHSLELRVPLLDNEVVAVGLGLPDRQKVRGVETKVVLREIVTRRLPPEIGRRPKQGFEVPIDLWFRSNLLELATDLLSPSRLRRRGLFDPAVADRLLREHLSGSADHGLRLYALVVAELWLDGLAAVRRASATPR